MRVLAIAAAGLLIGSTAFAQESTTITKEKTPFGSSTTIEKKVEEPSGSSVTIDTTGSTRCTTTTKSNSNVFGSTSTQRTDC